MEGDTYITSSMKWAALKGVEDNIAPYAHDSPVVAQLRAAMRADHMNNRVTLEKSIQSPLDIMQHLLDPR